MTQRHDALTDFERSIIPALSPNTPHGAPRLDERKTLSGIVKRRHAGTPWAQILERPAHNPLQSLRAGDGILACEAVFSMRRKPPMAATPGWSTSPPSASAGVGRTPKRELANLRSILRRRSLRGTLGRGLATKIHVLLDADELPEALKLTPVRTQGRAPLQQDQTIARRPNPL